MFHLVRAFFHYFSFPIHAHVHSRRRKTNEDFSNGNIQRLVVELKILRWRTPQSDQSSGIRTCSSTYLVLIVPATNIIIFARKGIMTAQYLIDLE